MKVIYYANVIYYKIDRFSKNSNKLCLIFRLQKDIFFLIKIYPENFKILNVRSMSAEEFKNFYTIKGPNFKNVK